MDEPTPLGLWAIAPQYMTPEQVADLVHRVQSGETLESRRAKVASNARWDRAGR